MADLPDQKADAIPNGSALNINRLAKRNTEIAENITGSRFSGFSRFSGETILKIAMTSGALNIREAKERVKISELWRLLDLPNAPPAKGAGACRSPFRQDSSPSFSIYDEGRKWKDHATGRGGDAIDFLIEAGWADKQTAILHFLNLARIPLSQSHVPFASKTAPKPGNPDVFFLHVPSQDDLQKIGHLRNLDHRAFKWLAEAKILRTGYRDGYPVWALVDGPPAELPRVAEIRRMDGGTLPIKGNPVGAKGQTLYGSRKDWPVGASLLAESNKFSVLFCEGMPDFLAAAHFAFLSGRVDVCPVTMLGRSNKFIHPLAIELLRGRRIRFYPHDDRDDGGLNACNLWDDQIPNAETDRFSFNDLRRNDNKLVNDLNDCALIHPDDAWQLEELLP